MTSVDEHGASTNTPGRRWVRNVAQTWRLGLTALLTGAVVMILELTAFRLYAPYFGYSVYVWGGMIGMTMIALALGYAVGGYFADRRFARNAMYLAVGLSGVHQLLMLFAMHEILKRLSNAGEIVGPSVATSVIFVPAMIGLAMVCPVLTRLHSRVENVGAASGRVYSMSTAGSILGVFATSFYLVPEWGTRATLMVACGVTFATAISGLVRRRAALPLASALLAAICFAPPEPWAHDTIFAEESPYNLVRVTQQDGLLVLSLNEDLGSQTVKNKAGGWTGQYYDDFALGPLVAPHDTGLVLGMGAGGSIEATRRSAPSISFDAVEIDPKVVEVAGAFFHVRPEAGRLRIHVADARPWLCGADSTYDIIHIDLYHGGIYVPFYLATREFFACVHAHLNPDGVVIMNVVDLSARRRLLGATASTLATSFSSLFMIEHGGTNFVILAFARPRTLAWLRERLGSPEHPEPLRSMGQRASLQITELAVTAKPVFTDDIAPIEAMTREMLEEFRLRSEGVP